MLNQESQGGWGAGQPSKTLTNPFTQPAIPSQAPNPFLRKEPNGVASLSNPLLPKLSNPFTAPSSASSSFAKSPFGAPSTAPFGAPTGPTEKSPAPSFGQRDKSPANPSPFTSNQSKSTNSQAPKVFTKRSSPAPAGPNINDKKKVADYVQPAWPKQLKSNTPPTSNTKTNQNQTNGKRKNENDGQRKTKFSRMSPNPQAASGRSSSAARNTKQAATFTNNGSMVPRVAGSTNAFAATIMGQLAKDNIKPPRWPENPGSLAQRQAIERFRETYKAYRERARKSLMKAGLIDDPDKRRRLDEALVFKGICEDFCPEWEKITRIVEHDIRQPERETDENGELVPMPSLMVKRLARSAAGQESPLPMDVRSVAALRRTLDYLIDDLIPSDDLLSLRHGFLWDRTRAIRIDFSFQKYAMTSEELKDQVYCLETIARFHVTALHILSQDGFSTADYSEQQEIEQLGKTLMSLIEVYDDCAQQEIVCENEAEFRAYYIIFNVHTPALLERISNWQGRSKDPDKIKFAICIAETMKNIREAQGPLSPGASPVIILEIMAVFFSAIAKPDVSYTMACFAEIHFNYVRKALLQAMRKSFSRPRFGPKDLSPALLKKHLRTDTEEEAVEFFKKHGFQFSEDGYMILSPVPEYVDVRVDHSFSRDIVERKRCGRSLPTVIHETVYEDIAKEPAETVASPEESLFVDDSQDTSFLSSNGPEEQDNQDGFESEVENSEDVTPPTSRDSSPRPLPSMFGNHVVTLPNTSNAQNEVGSRSPSLSSVTSASTKRSATPAVAEGSTETATHGDTFSSPNLGLTPVSSAGVFAGQPPKLNTQSGSVLGAPATPIFSNKSESNGAANTSTTPSTNIFSGLLSKTSDQPAPKLSMPTTFTPSPLTEVEPKPSDTHNKEQPQLPSTSTMPSLGLAFPTPTTSSTDPISGLSKNTDGSQPSVAPNVSPTLASGSKFPSVIQPATNATQPTNISTPSSIFPLNAQPDEASETKATTSTINQPSTLLQLQNTLSGGVSVSTNHILQQPIPTAAPNQQVTNQKKALDSFTRWFVCGDKGLMDEQLMQTAVDHALGGLWEEFQAAEVERKRKEELEKAWATARKYREYSLGVKYFYRWHQGFRDRQRINRMKVEREKARLWKSPENIAKRELAAKEEQDRIFREAKNSMLSRSQHRVDEGIKSKEISQLKTRVRELENTLSQSESSSSSLETRMQGLEDALIATGIFKGVRDERAAARHAARWEEDDADMHTGNMSLRAENHRRTKRGLNPLKASSSSETRKEGSKTAMLRALYNGPGRDTMSMSTGSLRNSTFSSSYRSSLGYNGSRVSKTRSRVSDPYWQLKARGLVRMPNGEYLHESVALPMLQEGKRIPGFGNYGLPPVQPATPEPSPLIPSQYSSTSIRRDEIRPDETSSPPSSTESRKRKRHGEDEVEIMSNVSGSPTGSKRAKNDGEDQLTDTQTHLDDIAKLLKRVEGRNTSRHRR